MLKYLNCQQREIVEGMSLVYIFANFFDLDLICDGQLLISAACEISDPYKSTAGIF